MPAALHQFTVDELEGFPEDGNRYEVLHGVLLVTPQAGLPHQRIVARLAITLGSFLQAEPEVELWTPGVIRARPSLHLEPDILIGRSPGILHWEAVQEHWLAVEVSGVGSRAYDRRYKRDAYLELGIAEVWLVDLDAQQVLVSRPGGGKDVPHETALTWRSPGGRDLTLDIPALFRGLPDGSR
jgi:Uma2 family endonuclease